MSVTNSLITEFMLLVGLCVFVIAALAGIALGVGLNINSARTLEFMKAANRRVGVGKTAEPAQSSPVTDKSTSRIPNWSATTLFLLGGSYTIFMVLYVVEFPYVVAAMSKYTQPVIADILVTSLKWFLLLFGLAGIGFGILRLASSSASPAIRDKLKRWLSAGNTIRSSNETTMPLDNVAETHPRTTGVVLAVLSAFALVYALTALMNG